MKEDNNSNYNFILNQVNQKATKEKKVAKEESDIPEEEPTPTEPFVDVLNEYWMQLIKQELVEIKDTHKLRKKFSLRMFRLTCLWLAIIIIFLFVSGFHKVDYFDLPSSVLIALITSTTAAVIGLFIRGNKWLEPLNKQKK